jgi:gamma-glutamylcyclotransferase (GGCT)/AIG2-like uncharacterized protein YtfP
MDVETKPLGRKKLNPKRVVRGSTRLHSELDSLFVYGTLMKGGDIHDLLKRHDIRFLGKAKMRGDLYLFRSENYPGAIPTAHPEHFVHGELYKLSNPSKALTALDKAEGCDEGLFYRRMMTVMQNGRKVRAWAYLYAKSPARAQLLPNGKFLQMRKTA